jgi:hypothetical protein
MAIYEKYLLILLTWSGSPIDGFVVVPSGLGAPGSNFGSAKYSILYNYDKC